MLASPFCRGLSCGNILTFPVTYIACVVPGMLSVT
jgi:hypothetical protein